MILIFYHIFINVSCLIMLKLFIKYFVKTVITIQFKMGVTTTQAQPIDLAVVDTMCFNFFFHHQIFRFFFSFFFLFFSFTSHIFFLYSVVIFLHGTLDHAKLLRKKLYICFSIHIFLSLFVSLFFLFL